MIDAKAALRSAIFALAVCGAPSAIAQTPPMKIGISIQPGLFTMLPIYLATEKGWWKEVGLDPTFSSFASGPPQVAAAAAKTWDVGVTGSAPGVLGALRFDIRTIGISDDESLTNLIMGRADDPAKISSAPASLKGQTVLATVNTTVDYVLQNCLGKWGLQRSDVQVVNLAQAQIISAFASNEGRLAAVWAPNSYTLEDRANAKPVCTGKDANAIVPSNIVARGEFLKENPEAVARFMAVFLRGIAWSRSHRSEAAEMLAKYYKDSGVDIGVDRIKAEFDLRPTFTLDEQLKLMSRASGPSTADDWFKGLGAFLQSVGTVRQAPDPQTFLTDESLKRVAADAKLRAFAMDQ